MDNQQHSLDFKLIDNFLKDLAQLKQALDDESGQLDLHTSILVPSQQVEKNAKDACLIAVFQAAKHRSVEVLKNKFSLLFITQFVEIVDEQASEKLLSQFIEFLFSDHRHDGGTLASLVHNGHEVLRKSERCVLSWSLKDVDQNVSEGAD